MYQDLSYNMPLSVACAENNIEFVKYLVANGVSPNKNIIQRGEEIPLLDFAVKREEIELIKLLMQNGITQQEVLVKLVQENKRGIIEILLQQKDIDICSFSDDAKQDISNVLAQRNNRGIKKLLDDYIEIQNLDNQDRMMTEDDFMELDQSAVDNCNSQTEMELLLAMSVQKQEVELVKSLIQKGVNTDSVLFDAVLNNRYQTTKMLLDNDANKDAYNEMTGETVLYKAVENKNDAIVELLTRRKYRLNPNNKRDCDESIQDIDYINNGGYEKEAPIELARRLKRRKIEDILDEKNREDVIDMLCKGK